MTAAVTCSRCGKGVRGQARKRALYFGEDAVCSACEKKPPVERPREMRHGAYVATVTREETGPWGLETTWTITREGVEVGKMFQGGGGYGERPHCSLRALLWTGKMPERSWDPKSPEHGLGFDTGPLDTRELALEEFAKRADRLIAWRAAQEGTP